MLLSFNNDPRGTFSAALGIELMPPSCKFTLLVNHVELPASLLLLCAVRSSPPGQDLKDLLLVIVNVCSTDIFCIQPEASIGYGKVRYGSYHALVSGGK